jgi:uncharacterized membrane protein YczE
VLQSNFPYRLIKLIFGLFIYGIGVAMMVAAGIGVSPWDAFAQGVSVQSGLSFGQATIAVSAMVMLMWIPLRVKLGLGSVLNAVLIGVFADLALPVMPVLDSYWQKMLLFLVGMVIISFATGLYISCGMGKGPRDGLNTGLALRFNTPFWIARTAVEVAVVTIGFLLGGQVREGTLIFAIAIGYLNQLALRLFSLAGKDGRL